MKGDPFVVRRPQYAGPTPHSLPEFFGMDEEAKAYVRNNFVAAAYAQLPDLTPEERALGNSKMLTSECSYWRLRCRQMELDRDSANRRAAMLEDEVGKLTKRLDWILASFETETQVPPESAGESNG